MLTVRSQEQRAWSSSAEDDSGLREATAYACTPAQCRDLTRGVF